MKRLQTENKNTPTSYIQKPLDWFDRKRLDTLLSRYNGGLLLDMGSYSSTIGDIAFELSKNLKLDDLVAVDAIDWVPEKLSEEDETYDYIVMGQLLEHMNDPVGTVKEAVRVLKIGGVLALSVPLNETEAGEVDKDFHVWSFSEQDIVDLLKPYGRYEIEILRSEHIPQYRYHFPHIIGFVKKQ